MRETLSPSRTKTSTKTLLHTLTKYTNSPVQPSQSSPPSLSPAHSPPNSTTSVQSPLPPLQNTPTYNRASIQLHTLIYLNQHTGPLDVSREGGSSASRVEGTPGRATLTSWVVGPLHSYMQEGLVDNNNRMTEEDIQQQHAATGVEENSWLPPISQIVFLRCKMSLTHHAPMLRRVGLRKQVGLWVGSLYFYRKLDATLVFSHITSQ